MSVVELLEAYGSAFWKSPQVAVSQDGDLIRVRHPGFYEPVEVHFDDIRDFNDVDAAVLMSCKPTGRHGYVSAFRREVLVRPCGDPLSEHVVASGVVADELVELVHDDMRFRLGPASTVLRLTFSHLYPLEWVDMGKEYAIQIEPAYVESISDDDLTRRLAQLRGHERLRRLVHAADRSIDRFLVEISAVLSLHLRRWDVPEALEFGLMESKRQSIVAEPRPLVQVYPYVTGVQQYLRAMQVNEPHLRALALIQVVESHYTYQAHEATVTALRSRLTDGSFDPREDGHILELISAASRATDWRDRTVEILATLVEEYVDERELEAAVRDLLDEEAVAELASPEGLSRWVHDLKQHLSDGSGVQLSRLGVDQTRIAEYVAFVQWLTVTIMRGNALREELIAATS